MLDVEVVVNLMREKDDRGGTIVVSELVRDAVPSEIRRAANAAASRAEAALNADNPLEQGDSS